MMKPLHRKSLFFFSYCRSRPQAPAFQACELSYSSQHSRRAEEESRNARVSVWWDFENCNVPVGADALKVAPAITQALRANGIKGPLQITAFGDVLQLSRANQEALSSTGVHLTHIPNGGKNSADKFFDLMYWVSQNPPPAHLFLISGDRNLAGILHRLRMNNYNILLAVPGRAPDVLCTAANITWQWSSLLRGEDLNAKHFNHPPDGALGSRKGSYEAPLENPLLPVEPSTSLQNVQTPEPCSDSKLGAIPESVVRKVRDILSSHPQGISIKDILEELTKCSVHLDKSLYGYQNFSRFLLSMPDVHLQSLGDGRFYVHLIPSKSPKSFKESVVSSAVDVERGYAATPKLNALDKNMGGDADETTPVSSFHQRSMNVDSKSFQPVSSQGKPVDECVDGKSSFPSMVTKDASQPQNGLQKSSTGGEEVLNVANAKLEETHLPAKDDKVSKSERDSSKMRSKKSLDNDIAKSENASHKIPEKYTESGNHSAGNDHTSVEINGSANYESGKFKAKNEYENPTRKEVDEVCGSPYTSPVDDSPVDKRPGEKTETDGKSPTFFSWIRSWWPFWKSKAESDDSTAQQKNVVNHFEDPKLSEEPKLSEVDQNVCHSGKPKLFSSFWFWIEMESFVFSRRGSLLCIHSRSREDLAQKLRKDGPLVLRSLTEKDIIQLVELLISEKKWLEETRSEDFAFRLTQPVPKSSLTDQSHDATGLRNLFLSRNSNLQKSVEHDVEKHDQSISHNKVSPSATKTKNTERSRNDIIADCQKLVSEILRKHPKGYNVCLFREHFANKYGYHLDLKKLGYLKLASLLQTMPGVRIELSHMFPSGTNACSAVSGTDGELSNLAPKDDNMESQWEELGPVSVNNSKQSDLESKVRQKAIELDTSKHPYYEPIDVDGDFSESDEDSSCLTQIQIQGNPKRNEQDSPFWQTLDLWHSSKEKGNSAKKSDDVDVLLGNHVVDVLSTFPNSTQVTPSKLPSGNYGHKRRSQKNYSFVSEPSISNKNMRTGGLTDGSKKADESKMQN